MSDPESITESQANVPRQQADQIRTQAAALADHLLRSGIRFLPKPNPENVAALAGSFAPPTSASTSPAESAKPADRLAADATPKPVADPQSRPPAARSKPQTAPAAPVDPIEQPYPGPELPAADRAGRLDIIEAEVAVCTRCEVLASCRTQTVFGEGSPNPRIAFFGEGPGADEDRTGRPFVGKAGQLLTKMIEACSFAREDVYILNTVKCRPPGNRNPEPVELQNCREYFERQLAILRPEYIVCLGAVSSQTLLQSKLSVGRLRGKLHRYFESKVLVTYHPAYLLRNPDAKKATWQDLQLMLRDAGIKVGKKG